MAKSEPLPPFLNDAERNSPLWRKIKAYCEERLSTARHRNDSNLDDRRTANLRGRIAELKHLATLDQPAPQTEANDDFPD